MGFQISEDPKVYIQKILVHAYLIKWLRNIEVGLDLIPKIEHSARNYKCLLAQSGVAFLFKKSRRDTIYIKYRFKNVIHEAEFGKNILILEADAMITCLNDPNKNDSVLFI